MIFLIRARIPTEAGNKMVQDPNFLKKIEEYINKIKAEANYFFESDSNRVVAFIMDIQSAYQIPIITEPLFSGMDAHVELHPVMSLDDLKKGIPQAIVEANSYRY
jgi:hypothetical protein